MGKIADPAGITQGGGIGVSDQDAYDYYQKHYQDSEFADNINDPNFDIIGKAREILNQQAQAVTDANVAASNAAADKANQAAAASQEQTQKAQTSIGYSKQATQNVRNNQLNVQNITSGIAEQQASATPQQAKVDITASDDEASRKRPGGYTQRSTGIRLS